MYKGWLLANSNIVEELKRTCQIIITNQTSDVEYEIEVSDIGFITMDHYWGDAFWGLEKV